MSRYCLDTSAYSHFRRGTPEVVGLIDRAEWIGVPAITVGELRTGFVRGDRRAENEAELARFLAHPVVSLVPVDGEVAHHFAEMIVDLRDAGTPLPTNDVWIAATAARVGSLVLTYDRHYEKVVRVGSLILGT
jgi:tRNA(fMet)-specific endonuclease VapC